MSKRQQRRAEVLGRLSAGAMSKDEAGALLGLSRRQINRALKKYTGGGISRVVHGNTGLVPVNKTDISAVNVILSLVGNEGKYHDFRCFGKPLSRNPSFGFSGFEGWGTIYQAIIQAFNPTRKS